MNPVNTDKIKSSSSEIPEDLKEKNSSKFSGKFDISIIGKIDLIEAEKIAKEEVLFLTETDLIEGLEDFELVPIKNYKDDLKTDRTVKIDISDTISEDEIIQNKNFDLSINEKKPEELVTVETFEEIEEKYIPVKDSIEKVEPVFEKLELEFSETDLIEHEEKINFSDANAQIAEKTSDVDEIIIPESRDIEITDEINEELPSTKKLFTIKINEETLDAQLSAILNIESTHKKDDKLSEKYHEVLIDSRCRFVDDQFLNKPVSEDTVSYNEDPLTERLVKMIEVADGKLELLEKTAKEEENINYILEDYTLYNSEKFDNVFKEEIFYVDSDFEFIDNAIIRDDFTKYIHEIDDYFESEESLIQSEISEILGLIPEENEYIEDKLFGDYYKRYDLDNEIDFIKPEIDFFRSNYTGTKNLSYFSESSVSLLDSEKWSIEEDISSPDAIVFEEDISEIEAILKRDYNYDLNKIENIKPEILEVKSKDEIPDITEEIISLEEITDITDKVIILDDKEKLMELVSEYPEKHENLIRLLSYLDGLFEKLPEEVIRKFAESEYFELYSKVLKEMGV